MNKYYSTLLLAVLIFTVCSITACKKINDQLEQSVTWDGIDVIFTAPPDTAASAFNEEAYFDVDIDSFINNKTSGVMRGKNIKSIFVKSCTLTITNPDSVNNFANVSGATVELSTSVNSTLTKLTGSPTIPAVYTTTLDIPVNSSIDIKNYLTPPSSGSQRVRLSYRCVVPTRTNSRGKFLSVHEVTIIGHVSYIISLAK